MPIPSDFILVGSYLSSNSPISNRIQSKTSTGKKYCIKQRLDYSFSSYKKLQNANQTFIV